MKTVLRLFLIVMSLAVVAAGQQPAQQQALPKPAPFLSTKICGKGVFLVSLGTETMGRESFEIQCGADGYRASGNTTLKLPNGTLSQDTAIEVDKEGVPRSLSARGSVAGTAFEQSTVFKDGKAATTIGGETREAPYTNRAAVFVNAVTYLMQFVGARYDVARGGPQEIPLFPNLNAQMERTGRDEVSAANVAMTAKPVYFDRYSFNLAGAVSFVWWTDMDGRLAAVYVPSQKFLALREEYAAFSAPLLGALANVKGIVPDYSAPATAPFTAEDVSVEAKGFKLAATLLLPKTGKRPFPAVVMSTGSGQQERDSNIAGLKGYRPFREIAEYLASRGIAVLRADDRGVGSSGGLNTLDAVTTFDFADDVRAQIAYLRARSDIDPARIVVIGHSEGGIIAPLVAASDPKLAGIILMAGTGKPGEEVLRFQLNYAAENNPKLTEAEKAKKRAESEGFIRAIKENGDVSKYPALLRGLSSPWGRAFLAYDPLTTIRKVRQPILILQGALDRQVTAEQARMLEEAARRGGNRDVTMRVFPNLNHLFLPAKSGAETEYTNLETYSLGDDVLRAIADWLQVKLKVGK
ncbi:MAG TPA: alpha/beta fold hydrolase [Pyrinomonadaceae bacterium]|nr:alpha/beta fold hydrolase [Pyrinomonadaceae bacterium]